MAKLMVGVLLIGPFWALAEVDTIVSQGIA